MFDVFYYGPKPNLFEFEQPADSLEAAAALTRTGYYWYIYGGNDYSNFDFDYKALPWQSQYTHSWPNQWYQYGGTYLAHPDTVANDEYHFHEQMVPVKPNKNKFKVLRDVEFDWSWEPHPLDPPYIYVFGNQWYPGERMPTVEYHAPGARERKYLDYPRATLPERHDNHWHTLVDCEWDYSWVPDPHDPPYIYVFGNQHWAGERSASVEYHVPGATERKFIQDLRAELGTLDIFFLDKGNDTAQTRFEKLQAVYPAVVKVRYINSLLDTIHRCTTKTKTNRFWVISSEYDYTGFDFSWQPEPWQQGMTHVFPSQHQKWSDTFLINKWEFERHEVWAKNLEEFPNLNFVSNQTVVKPDNTYNIYYVDHGNPGSQDRYHGLQICLDIDIVKTRFVDNYLDTFKRIMSTATTEYVWIINSICDYAEFDFTWEPEPWQREMIHVFPSSGQDRGDTFRIHVESFKQQMIDLELLDWFNVINYCNDQSVHRLRMPTHRYSNDDLVSEIKNYNFETPYVLFTNQPDLHIGIAPCLWSPKDRVVMRCSRAGATAIVPRDIKANLRTQIYDYPYIEVSNYQVNDYLSAGRFPQLDIVFISNGEPDEQKWYEHTCYISNSDVKWVRGINGRVAAYQEAARQSETPWFFAVFAKLEVLGGAFDWFWMPDYFQEPKHYIFNALNPVNGLEYGHQGMIAYNKNLVLANNTPGIDFTLTQPHESVPILSGIAHFNQDAWMTWRTAFREVVKLKYFMSTEPTVETEHRLNVWCTKAEGNYADDCLAGAKDAVAYYNEVGGDYEKLKLSFEWAWLRERFNASTQQ